MYGSPRDALPQLKKFLVVLGAHRAGSSNEMAEPRRPRMEEVRAHGGGCCRDDAAAGEQLRPRALAATRYQQDRTRCNGADAAPGQTAELGV